MTKTGTCTECFHQHLVRVREDSTTRVRALCPGCGVESLHYVAFAERGVEEGRGEEKGEGRGEGGRERGEGRGEADLRLEVRS